MGQALYIREESNPVLAPAGTATAFNIGDFVSFDGTNAVPGASWTWDTSKAVTQAAFVAGFLGHCYQFKAAGSAQVYGNSDANAIGVSTSGTYQADVQSATTFELGDYVGLAKNPDSNALLSQVVEKVDDADHAIGVCVEAGANLSQVKFRILSKKLPLSR